MNDDGRQSDRTYCHPRPHVREVQQLPNGGEQAVTTTKPAKAAAEKTDLAVIRPQPNPNAWIIQPKIVLARMEIPDEIMQLVMLKYGGRDTGGSLSTQPNRWVSGNK